MATVLLDENIDGYAKYLSRLIFSSAWSDIGSFSLETMIRTRTLPTSLPVLTISDIHRFRSESDHVEALVAKSLEYFMAAENLRGAGRLY